MVLPQRGTLHRLAWEGTMTGNSWKTWGRSYGYSPEAHGFLESLGFTDSSYGNDAAPSFHHDELGLRLWIDAVEEADRECAGLKLTLVHVNEDMEYVREVFSTDSWAEMAARLRALRR